jgi:hypothetical protein
MLKVASNTITINHPRNDRSHLYTTEETKEESTYRHIVDHIGKSWRLNMDDASISTKKERDDDQQSLQANVSHLI